MQAHAFSRTSGARNPIVIVLFLEPEQGTCTWESAPVFTVIIIRAQAGRPVKSLLFF